MDKEKNNVLLILNNLFKWVRANGIVLVIIVIFIILSSLDRTFLSIGNLRNLFEQYSVLGIVAAGITISLISGNIDLVPGSLIALSGIIFGLVFTLTGSIILAILACIATSVAVQCFNAFLIAKVGIFPIIITLAAMIWARGLTYAISNGESIVIRHEFIDFMNSSFWGITPNIVILVVVFIISWFILNKTKMGKYAYGLGKDKTAVRRAGINIVKYNMLIFIYSGVLIGIASVVSIGRLGSAQVNAGLGMELLVLASIIIGGNSMYGGAGGVGKTILGIIFLAIVHNGLRRLGLLDSHIAFFTGMIIVFSLSIQSFLLTGRGKRGFKKIA